MTPRAPRSGFRPEGYAQALLHDLSFTTYPIDPAVICGYLGIGYREDDMGSSGGYDGALVRESGMAGILVNSNIPYAERRRFTAAHELGHYTIKHHNQAEYWCTGRDLAVFRSDRVVEAEANAFASELLLPEKFLGPILKRSSPSLELARDVAHRFGVSLTATALKLVRLAPDSDACALILSENGKPRWAFPSHRFRKVMEVRSSHLAEDTYAIDFFAGKTLPVGPQKVSVQAWGALQSRQTFDHILEHSVPFQDLGLVLTMLTLPEADPDDLSWEDLDE